MFTLSLSAARNLALAAQGLLSPPPAPATKTDVLDAIRRMGVLQIDTIHVVARSPYLTLFTRLGDYDPNWLDELLAEGRLFEYWAHAACFLPIEDYPLQRRTMLNGVRGWYDAPKWIEEHADLVNGILARIRAEGAVRSADFENHKPSGGWWNWKEEKVALEVLHTTGELMIARREKFQRVYDLRERVLPGWDDANAPSADEVRRELVLRSVEKLGLARPNWVWDYYRLPKTGLSALLRELAASGELIETAVEGWESPAYVHPVNTALLEQARNDALQPTYTTLLSPFDPLVWDRVRARELFDFDYMIECYTPAPKRRYGYFSLPILRRGALVGRLDAKAYRQEGRFEVRSLYFEPDVSVDDGLLDDVAGALLRCAAWHKTPRVEVQRSQPEEALEVLKKRVKREE
ncbi:uncharacterized protein conserved in bacteria [Longilinea arvoryzae]|uniref:Uncharacterized protein conserved in bacteria n=1 Tax=Longilinea arvoryzae TaxID=360412 RepID=A0A0S7BCH1_9CHLR|nr:crosslink repair DNA glycosylase YcaQ family protein [Longilinea arvoryzae]GAP12973.1 uncharacterized protein conserved in bacteria [Longilinea arvoryzae]